MLYYTVTYCDTNAVFCGTLSNKERESRAFQLTLDVFRYHIGLNKLEKKTPVLSNILTEINDSLGTKGIWVLQNFKPGHWLL